MSRDDLQLFRSLDIDCEAIGLGRQEGCPYFCTPVGAEFVGWIGCDGVHFVLLPGDERVYCVDPMGTSHVLPVGADFREFVSFLLYCRDANPLSQLYWMGEGQFRELLREDRERESSLGPESFEKKEKALAALAEAFRAEPRDPYGAVKAWQAAFDPAMLAFSGPYYDALGLEDPREAAAGSVPEAPFTVEPCLEFQTGREEEGKP